MAFPPAVNRAAAPAARRIVQGIAWTPAHPTATTAAIPTPTADIPQFRGRASRRYPAIGAAYPSSDNKGSTGGAMRGAGAPEDDLNSSPLSRGTSRFVWPHALRFTFQ